MDYSPMNEQKMLKNKFFNVKGALCSSVKQNLNIYNINEVIVQTQKCLFFP